MPFMFEKLEVYRKAVDFADEIIALTEAFPSQVRHLQEPFESSVWLHIEPYSWFTTEFS